MLGRELKGRYKIIRSIGSGGFGKTYLAEDTHRPGLPYCVVKQLVPVSKDVEFLQMARRLFNLEAEILEKLGSHPQIPQLLAYFEEDKEFYLVEEFIEGDSFKEQLTVGVSLPEIEVIKLLKELLIVLAFIHEKGIIHRDIKPSNIIKREKDNRFILIDFGAVKQIQPQVLIEQGNIALTTLTIAIGTTDYAPLEQLAGQPRFNSDIYSLGIVAIQALTGTLPSQLKRDSQTGTVMWHHLTQVREDLANIIDKMTHPTFVQRYQSAVAVIQDLEKLELANSVDSSTIAPTITSNTAPNIASTSLDQTTLNCLTLSSPEYTQIEEIFREFVGVISPILLRENLTQVFKIEDLVEKLLLYLPQNQRREFQSRVMTVVQKYTHSKELTVRSQPKSPTSFTKNTKIIDDSFVNRCEQELTDLIGPISTLLVQVTIKSHPQLGLEEILEILAAEIPDSQKAAEFRRRLLS